MGIPRLISIFLLAVGLYLLGQDASALINGTSGVPQPLEAVWRRLDPSSLYAAQSFAERHLMPEIWDNGVAILLKLPAWTLPLGFGLGLLVFDVFSQGRARKRSAAGN
jgi:hypothetical protein